MAIRQEANAPLIVTTGVVSGLLFLVIVFGTQAWFVKEERDEQEAKWRLSKNEQLDDLRKVQRDNIHRAGPTSVPIDRAMQLVVQAGGKSLAAPAPGGDQKK